MQESDNHDDQEVACIKEVATMVFRDFGVPVEDQKTECTSTLGFVLDTRAFQLRLFQEKLEWMRKMVHGWRTRWNCTWRELESLLGHLSHVAVAV